MTAPKVFISYSHDSQDHKAWVLKLTGDLRANGVDAVVDQWDLTPGQDVAAFMHQGISTADRVLLICTDAYIAKAEGGVGGVGYERLIVTGEVVQSIDTKKFIPLVRAGSGVRKIPNYLGERLWIDFRNDSEYASRIDELLREIHGAPAVPKPPIGANPFSGEVKREDSPARIAGPSGITSAGSRVLDEGWFADERKIAVAGAEKIKLPSHMELRFGLHDAINKSQIDLLNAVRKSVIPTFGWPIAVTLESREEYRPRAYQDGIRAEISIEAQRSYDYWAARRNGDFYLLQSLFEDARGEGKLFFNTRIVRVTEALMFASNYYQHLGVPPEAKLSVRVKHDGLAGRTLTSSTFNRYVQPRQTRENSVESEVVLTVGNIGSSLVETVETICSSMFMLFDFQSFKRSVYEDIVNRFVDGGVS